MFKSFLQEQHHSHKMLTFLQLFYLRYLFYTLYSMFHFFLDITLDLIIAYQHIYFYFLDHETLHNQEDVEHQ